MRMTYPEEAGEIAPVPGAGVQHVRSQNATDDGDDVVKHAPQHHRLDLQPPGRDLGHERVAHGTDRQLVAQGPDQHDAARGQGGLRPVRGQAQEAEDQEHAEQDGEAVEIEGSAANAHGDEDPGAEHAHAVDGILAQGKGVRLV